jgi:hypothetical protein
LTNYLFIKCPLHVAGSANLVVVGGDAAVSASATVFSVFSTVFVAAGAGALEAGVVTGGKAVVVSVLAGGVVGNFEW